MPFTDRVMRHADTTRSATVPTSAARVTRTPAGNVAHLLHLQRTYGNASVTRLIQYKLVVSQPGDVFEQEADRVADAAMAVGAPSTSAVQRAQTGEDGTIRRRCAACEADVHRDAGPAADEEKDEQLVSRAAAGEAQHVEGPLESDIRGLSGGGQPMAADVRTDMESRMGFDFGAVRVHDGSQASQMARSVNAHAFTVGNDVVFASGQFRPDTADGKRLLAHELTHVVQQNGAKERQDGQE